MAIEAFSGKTALAVKQDFYAGIFMMTTAAVMAFPVAEEVKKLKPGTKRKHSQKINRVNALAMVKQTLTELLNSKTVRSALKAFDNILRATTQIVRPNRKALRKKLKKKPPAMNYKQL